MGIYYFAVDYETKIQIWSPPGFSVKKPGIYSPNHPLPNMIIMKNIQGYKYEIINDMNSYDEHDFGNVTEQVYQELKDEFPGYDWENSEWYDEEIKKKNE